MIEEQTRECAPAVSVGHEIFVRKDRSRELARFPILKRQRIEAVLCGIEKFGAFRHLGFVGDEQRADRTIKVFGCAPI